MVEGGGRVIHSFLTKTMVDTIIITTAPQIVGADSIGHGMKLESERVISLFAFNLALRQSQEITGFKLVAREKFGNDVVVAWTKIPMNES